MTAGFGPHLTPDEFDAWLAAGLEPDRVQHLELCLECQARAESERALDEQLAALQLLSPAPDLADRVMRHVAIPRPITALAASYHGCSMTLVATPRIATQAACAPCASSHEPMEASVSW